MKKIILPLLLLLLVIFLLTQTQLGNMLRTGDLQRIAHYIQTFGIWAIVVSCFITILQTFFPLVPYFLIAGVNVLIFGGVAGFFITWLSATIGATLSFFMARYVAFDWAQKKVGKQPFFAKWNVQAKQRGFRIILMARLIPVIPSSMINLAAGLSEIRISPYLLATLIGKIPITILEATMGHDLFEFHAHKLRFLLMITILGMLMWLGSVVGKKAEKK